MIPVTKPYLPNRAQLNKYIDGIYERQWLTNDGQLVKELTVRLEEYLGVENLLLVANGTLALQIAYQTLGINEPKNGSPAQVVTTPFTFIATASSIKWHGAQPVFADIDPQTWCLAPANIETAITSSTRAIVPVHVFGNACDVEAIKAIAEKHSLKIIYDASHAFGVGYKGESLLRHGDAATLSFHATKLFHTGEGGAIVFKRKEDLERAKKIINFGLAHTGSIELLGINAKMNELQAAMGLCVLDEMASNLDARYAIWAKYERELAGFVKLQKQNDDLSYNAAYFPAVFKTEQETLRVARCLQENGILARRYFFPSLNTVDFLDGKDHQTISTDIAGRILCLPIYSSLSIKDQQRIIDVVQSCVNEA